MDESTTKLSESSSSKPFTKGKTNNSKIDEVFVNNKIGFTVMQSQIKQSTGNNNNDKCDTDSDVEEEVEIDLKATKCPSTSPPHMDKHIKDEPKDDIKNYAEDTMNELLGWYGYGKEALTKAPEKHRRKRDVLQPIDLSPKNISGDETSGDEDINSISSQTSGRKSSGLHAPSLGESMPCESNTSVDEIVTATELKADEPTFVVCSWCQKGKSLEKQYVLLTSEGRRKFCSQQCFEQCRREKYRKHKICDWCKENCGSSNIVEFEDGEGLYLFCSDDCLNKYKMNIFCQETQEHIKVLQAEGALKTKPPTSASTGSEQIIITPELWTEENQQTPLVTKKEKSISNQLFMDIPRTVEKNARESAISQSAIIPSFSEHHSKPVRNPRHTAPSMRVKSELETRHSTTRSSNQRPPRMTDREKIKQIRLRDNLPLYTPLRETCRSNSGTETFSIASLTARNSSPPSISTAQQSMFSIASSLYNSSPSSQLLGALTGVSASTAYHNIQHSPNQLKRDREKIPIDGRTSSDSTSSSSVSPRTTSQALTTPIPPLYPPPNPFTHTPVPPYFNNPAFPFPIPPGLSMYSGLYNPSSLLGPLAGASPMTSIMPPNTLMMPYPFILPLPIPLPIPIPVPEKFMEELKNASVTKSNTGETTSTTATNSPSKSKDKINNVYNDKLSINGDMSNDSVVTTSRDKSCDNSQESSSNNKQNQMRYYIDLDPSSHHLISSSASDVDTENEVMDLSTDTNRGRSRSRSPVMTHSVSSNDDYNQSSKDNSTAAILVIQPEDSRLTPPKSPFYLPGTSSGVVGQRYSSRRNLILDAPNVQREGSRSPSPEKRNYSGPTAREILYGKRKCVRARIKTK